MKLVNIVSLVNVQLSASKPSVLASVSRAVGDTAISESLQL